MLCQYIDFENHSTHNIKHEVCIHGIQNSRLRLSLSSTSCNTRLHEYMNSMKPYCIQTYRWHATRTWLDKEFFLQDKVATDKRKNTVQLTWKHYLLVRTEAIVFRADLYFAGNYFSSSRHEIFELRRPSPQNFGMGNLVNFTLPVQNLEGPSQKNLGVKNMLNLVWFFQRLQTEMTIFLQNGWR